MGPLRGGVILFTLASPALSEVCDKERPTWDGTTATALTEAIALFSSPLGLLLLVATAFALRLRSTWGGLATTVGLTVFVSIVIAPDASGIRKIAMTEGCIGPPTLFITVCIAICIGTILYTAPRRPGDN